MGRQREREREREREKERRERERERERVRERETEGRSSIEKKGKRKYSPLRKDFFRLFYGKMAMSVAITTR